MIESPGKSEERLYTEIWNDIEKGIPITWREANKLRIFLRNKTKKVIMKESEIINWAQVKLKQ